MTLRRLPLLLASLSLLLPAAPPESYVPQMEKVLMENILSFWYPKTLDDKFGGYTIRYGPDGQWLGDGPKAIVTQARQVWFFARMARAGYGDKAKMLAAADHGYKFLTTKMWDAKNGGFYWEVDATGDRKTRPKKHLYGQSFALYAISEYALASGRKDVLEFAEKFFNLLEVKAHDAQYGGYREFFNEDWTPAPPGEPSYMQVDPTVKLMNTHLHLMEAMTTFYRASKLPAAHVRLIELMTIENNAVLRKKFPGCSDQYSLNWTPILRGGGARSSYGHDLENIWLLVDAAGAAGQPVYPMLDFFKENFAYNMKYGWDAERGGFFYFGEFNQPAANRNKSWWVQSEVLVSALNMYKLTRDPVYWEVFEKTWDFVQKYHVDWKTGEWWEMVSPELKQTGDKAGPWKAGYHNGRAMIESIALLKSLTATQPPAETGFKTIFDGKTLNGWTLAGGHGRGYLVEDGVLVCPADGGGNLYTEKEYANFVLRFDWRLWEGGNNGVGVRAPLQGDAAYKGMEIQILDDEADVYQKMGLKPTQYTGSVYDVLPAKRGAVKRNGQWNTEEIVANGRQIKVTLNGQVVTDVNLDSVKDPEVLAKHPGLANVTGHLGFLGHGTRVEFRNIRVKELN